MAEGSPTGLGANFYQGGSVALCSIGCSPRRISGRIVQTARPSSPFSFEQARAIIERDLGKPITDLFHWIEPEPLAAASLGQVHRAQLLSGEQVVVKVQRPGLRKLFAVDLAILRRIAQYFHHHPRYGRGRDWLGIYEECRRILYEEADYLNEGRNADTFRATFGTTPK